MRPTDLEGSGLFDRKAPTLAAGGLVWNERNGSVKIALVKQKNDGLWHLPKGKYSPKDKSLKQAAIREVREETGCDVKVSGFADSLRYRAGKKNKIVLFWHMKLRKPKAFKLHDDIVKFRWFTPDKAAEKLGCRDEKRLLIEQLPNS